MTKKQKRIEPVSARLFENEEGLADFLRALHLTKEEKNKNTLITEAGKVSEKLTIILPFGWGDLWHINGQKVARWSEAPQGTYEAVVEQKLREAASRLQSGLDYIPEHNLPMSELLQRVVPLEHNYWLRGSQ